MKTEQRAMWAKGFSLLELLVSVAILLIVSGAIFSLLNVSQRRYQSTSQVLDSFQDARLALNQIIRDANDAGYPPPSNFSTLPGGCTTGIPCLDYVDSPIAWNPSYTTLTTCTITVNCVTPTGFDVIFEENPNGAYNNIQWIRYQLVGTTLFRGSTGKQSNTDPAAATSAAGVMYPYITNVMNNASAAQIATFKATYPAMFPGGNAQPIFQYYCTNPTAPPPTVLCQNAAGSITLPNGSTIPGNSPANVVDVEVTLILKTTQNDPQTKAPLLVELNGLGHRVNPIGN